MSTDGTGPGRPDPAQPDRPGAEPSDAPLPFASPTPPSQQYPAQQPVQPPVQYPVQPPAQYPGRSQPQYPGQYPNQYPGQSQSQYPPSGAAQPYPAAPGYGQSPHGTSASPPSSAPQYGSAPPYGSVPPYGSPPPYGAPPQYSQQAPSYYGSAPRPGGVPPFGDAAAPAWQWNAGAVAPMPPRIPARIKIAAVALLACALAAGAGGVALAGPGAGAKASPTKGAAAQDQQVRALWRTATADDLLPLSLSREGTETYQRVGVDPDEQCSTLPAAMLAALHPGVCSRVIQATYVDRTQTVTATVGIVLLSGTASQRSALFQGWTADSYSANTAMMPNTYPVPDTLAANFQDSQRVAWQSQVSTDGTYLVYTVAGFTDGRTGPTAAARTAGSGSALESDSPPVQVASDLPTAIQQILAAKETAVLGTSGS